MAPKFLRGELEEEPLTPPSDENPSNDVGAVPTDFQVDVDGEVFQVKVVPTGYMEIESTSQIPTGPVEGGVTSTMQGMILKLKVAEGDKVNEGDVVAVLEAMKMENNIHAPESGVVEEVFVEEGDTVNAGDPLMVIK